MWDGRVLYIVLEHHGGTWREMHCRLCINFYGPVGGGGEVCVWGGGLLSPHSPSGSVKILCKDDSPLFSRFLYGVH